MDIEDNGRYIDFKNESMRMWQKVGDLTSLESTSHIYEFKDITKEEFIKDLVTAIYGSIVIGFRCVNSEMPAEPIKLGDFPSDDSPLPLRLIHAKIARHVSNMLVMLYAYKDSWADQVLDYDLYRLHSWLDFYCRQELKCTLNDIVKPKQEIENAT